MKKKFVRSILILTAPLFIASCNNDNKSKTENPAVIDSSQTSNKMSSATDTSSMQSPNTNNGNMTGSANDFVTAAAGGGMMEVELGKLAQKNSMNSDVKEYGKMLETDHTKANETLKSIATAENISIPMEMPADHLAKIKEMEEKKGTDFDKAYITMMVEDHNEVIDEFKKAAAGNSNQKVKEFATKTLPILEKHLARAKAIQSKMK